MNFIFAIITCKLSFQHGNLQNLDSLYLEDNQLQASAFPTSLANCAARRALLAQKPADRATHADLQPDEPLGIVSRREQIKLPDEIDTRADRNWPHWKRPEEIPRTIGHLTS